MPGTSQSKKKPAKKAKRSTRVKKIAATQARRQRENKARFLEVLVDCPLNISKAARAAGISDKTVHRWRNDDEEFADQVQQIRDGALYNVQDAVYDSAVTPDEYGRRDMKAAQMLLASYWPDRYGKKEEKPTSILQNARIIEVVVKTREEAEMMSARKFVTAVQKGQRLLESP